MAAALGVATVAYLPFCFFNLASPVISLLYGFTGFRIERVEPTGEPPASSPDIGPIASQPLEGGPA
jgi:NhaC family Na+:H+ antiporter